MTGPTFRSYNTFINGDAMTDENQEGNGFPEIQLLPDFVHEGNES